MIVVATGDVEGVNGLSTVHPENIEKTFLPRCRGSKRR